MLVEIQMNITLGEVNRIASLYTGRTNLLVHRCKLRNGFER